MPRPDRDVVELLELWLSLAKSGELRTAVIVGRFGCGEYDEGYSVNLSERDELLYELQSALIRLRIKLAAHDRPQEKEKPRE